MRAHVCFVRPLPSPLCFGPGPLVLLLLLGCGKSNPVTANGTVLFEWDTTKSTRFPAATVVGAPRTSKDYTVTVSEPDTPPFALTLHVEIAPVDFTEAGQPVHQVSPVALEATVKSNTGWKLSGKCSDGPNYKMPSIGPDGGTVTAQGMIQDCTVKHDRMAGMIFQSSWQLGFTLNVIGDGKVEAFPDTHVKIE